MPKPNFEYRQAEHKDADDLARFINIAGEGLPHYLWDRMAEAGEDAWGVGAKRACREDGGFSYRNAIMATLGDAAAACLISYALPPSPEPFDPTSVPAMFVPLMELENLAPNNWYINVLAAYPQFRGQGLGSRLLEIAQQKADQNNCAGLSLIVSDANQGAIRLYQRFGFQERAARPMIKDEWINPGRNWVLLVK